MSETHLHNTMKLNYEIGDKEKENYMFYFQNTMC